MEQEAERGRFLSAAKARFAEGAAGYELEQAFERAAFGEEKHGRADDVQNAADCAGKNNYGEWRQGVPHLCGGDSQQWIGCSHSLQGTVFSFSGGVICCASVITLVQSKRVKPRG